MPEPRSEHDPAPEPAARPPRAPHTAPIADDWPSEVDRIPTGGPVGAAHHARRVVTGRLAVFEPRNRPSGVVMLLWAFSPSLTLAFGFAMALAGIPFIASSLFGFLPIGGLIALGWWSVVMTRDRRNPWWPLRAIALLIVMAVVNVGICIAIFYAGCACTSSSW